MQGCQDMGEVQNKMVIIIHHALEFLKLLDCSRSWKAVMALTFDAIRQMPGEDRLCECWESPLQILQKLTCRTWPQPIIPKVIKDNMQVLLMFLQVHGDDENITDKATVEVQVSQDAAHQTLRHSQVLELRRPSRSSWRCTFLRIWWLSSLGCPQGAWEPDSIRPTRRRFVDCGGGRWHLPCWKGDSG